jgi:hypothetical protein
MAQEELEDIFSGEDIEVDSTFGTDSGNSGSSGSSGSDGSGGSNGSSGSSGSSGSDSSGSSGSDGSGGSNGSSGSSGSSGSDGSNGSNGSSGSSGSSGSDGSDGSNGSSGSSGSSGSDGSDGSDGQETQTIECKSYTFLAELIPASSDVPKDIFAAKWYFPKYVYSEGIQNILKWFIRGVEKIEGKWCFSQEFIYDNYSGRPEDKYLELIDIDAKVLKYIILCLKNNPLYYKPDGYKYYFYDTLANIFKTIISSENIGIGGYINGGVIGYPISDNKIQLFDGDFRNSCIITIEEGYFEITNEDAAIKYLGNLKNDWDEIIKAQNKFVNDLGEFAVKKTFDKMGGFVRILEQILEE